jgi:hypothetical protein
MSGGRTAIVAALVGGAIAIVLIGWYRAGMREVDGQVAAAIAAQRTAAHDAEVAAAAAVTARLEALRVRRERRGRTCTTRTCSTIPPVPARAWR